MTHRDTYYDSLKGFLILSVVLGHAIQYCNGIDYLRSGAFFENPFFKFIYGFHMPLFMLISGYFFYSSLTKYTYKEIFIKKIKSLIIPKITNTLIYTIYMAVIFNSAHFFVCSEIYNTFVNSVWFFGTLFSIISVYLLFSLLSINKIYTHILFIIFCIFLPDCSIFMTKYFKFLYPFFTVGYYANRCRFNINNVSIYIVPIYFILLLFFHKQHYIYITGNSIYHNIGTSISIFYRYLLGITGCFAILKLFAYMKNNILSIILLKFGQVSFSIFYLSCFVNILFETNIIKTNNNFLYVFAWFLIISLFLYITSRFILSNNLLSSFILGRRGSS